MELLNKLPRVGQEDENSLEWIELIRQLRQYQDEEPSSPQVQSIVGRMIEKMVETFGDNKQFFEKIWHIRKSQDQSQKMSFYPLEPKLINLVEKAADIYLSKTKKPQ